MHCNRDELDLLRPSRGGELLPNGDELSLGRPLRVGKLCFIFTTRFLRVLVLWHALWHVDCSAFNVSFWCGFPCKSRRESAFFAKSPWKACWCPTHQFRRELGMVWVAPFINSALRNFSSYTVPQLSGFVQNFLSKFCRGLRSLSEVAHSLSQFRYIVNRDKAFQKELDDAEYAFNAPSWSILVEFDSVTRGFTAALVGLIRYCSTGHIAVLFWFSHESYMELNSCRKPITDIGSLPETVRSFICTAILFAIFCSSYVTLSSYWDNFFRRL